MFFKQTIIAATLAATVLTASPLQAQPIATGDAELIQVQQRKWRDEDTGAAIGAGILAFTIGAIVAGAANEQRRRDRGDRAEYRRWVEYCSRKYRSFDPDTGTYIARNGRERVCR